MPPSAASVVAERLAECAICFEPLSGLPVATLRQRGRVRVACPHYLHERCARRLQKKECPSCRAAFVEVAPFPSIDSPNRCSRFDAIDVDRNGKLTQLEVASALKATMPNLDVPRFDAAFPGLWARWDTNRDGTLCRDEVFRPDGLVNYVRSQLTVVSARPAEPPPLDRAAEFFAFWDFDNSGTLDKSEVHRALVKTFGLVDDEILTMADTLDAVWGIFDDDGDNHVDRREYARPDGLGQTLAASLANRKARVAQPYQPSSAPPLVNAVVDAQPYAPPQGPPPPYLPPGWDQAQTPDGRTYYIDHSTQRTSWVPP